jgi:hypothetical protein
VSPGIVCGADPGSGLYYYPKRDFEVVFSMRSDHLVGNSDSETMKVEERAR